MTLKFTRKCKRILPAALLAATALTAPQAAVAGDDLADAFKNGKLILDMRLRNETVSQGGYADDANGLTLRTRMGYETADYRGFKFLVEFDNIANVDDEDYNNTVNGKGALYPTIADPDITELNRAQFTYTGTDGFAVIAGRQRINLGNQRFIGAVGFRQNEQTFDAIVVQNTMIQNTTITYGYIDRIHRIFGDDHPLGTLDTASHAINVDVKSGPLGTVTAYGYLLDVKKVAALSRQTYGVRVKGNHKQDDLTISWDGEYAQQTDYADNPADVDVDFYSVHFGLAGHGFSGNVGYEVLGGDGVTSFATPLATLHKWQGFADMFLSTPAAGVKDLNASVAWSKKDVGKLKSLKLVAWYHDFEGDTGGMDMGSEVDLLVAAGLGQGWSVSAKYADYQGEGFKPDTQKLWLTVGFKY
jgi:hypothetical protein